MRSKTGGGQCRSRQRRGPAPRVPGEGGGFSAAPLRPCSSGWCRSPLRYRPARRPTPGPWRRAPARNPPCSRRAITSPVCPVSRPVRASPSERPRAAPWWSPRRGRHGPSCQARARGRSARSAACRASRLPAVWRWVPTPMTAGSTGWSSRGMDPHGPSFRVPAPPERVSCSGRCRVSLRPGVPLSVPVQLV
jgi:hypothetical protein